jgi:hypothetical protein
MVKKILFFSIAALISISPNFVSAQIPTGLQINDSQANQQPQNITKLSQEEFDGVLSTACDNSGKRNEENKQIIAKEIDQEIDASLSKAKLNELTETVLEINTLPTEEQSALCQSDF